MYSIKLSDKWTNLVSQSAVPYTSQQMCPFRTIDCHARNMMDFTS